MLNAMCATMTVPRPNTKRLSPVSPSEVLSQPKIALNSTRMLMPMTISGIIMGIYSDTSEKVLTRKRCRCRASAAIVPMMVETTVETVAIVKVFLAASMTALFLNRTQNQYNGPHGPWLTIPSNVMLVRDELKESTINPTNA